MFPIQRKSIALMVLSMVLIRCDEVTFRKVTYCRVDDGCSWHEAYLEKLASEIVHPKMVMVSPRSLPDVVKCAFWCQTDEKCLGFNYFNGTCFFFHNYSYIVYPRKGCILFEAIETLDSIDEGNPSENYNVAYKRKTCQSSAAVINGIVQGAWMIVDDSLNSCARMDEKAEGSNWWSIDMESPVKLKRVAFSIDSSYSHVDLNDMTIAVTNTSLAVWDSAIGDDSSECCNSEYALDTLAINSYTCTCIQSVLPGRYLIIQQNASYIALCSIEAYLA